MNYSFDSMSKVPRKLAQLRKDKHISVSNIAKDMLTDTKNVWRFEEGKVLPKNETIEKYARAIGVSIEITIKDERI